MKYRYLLLCAFLLAIGYTYNSTAQPYPEVSVKDIMTLPADSINAGSLRSPMLGDTVWVTGVVAVPVMIDPINDRKPILWAGQRWVSFLRDTSDAAQEYAGINILQASTTGSTTLFDRVRPGNIIRALVKVSNFPAVPLGGTQVELVNTDTEQIEFVDDTDAPTSAIPVEVSDFYTGPVGSQVQNFAEGSKYVGMQVELTDVTVVSLTQFDYVIADKAGNEMYVRSQSNYYTKNTDPLNNGKLNLRPDFEGFKVGQTFTKLRGYITSSNVPGGVSSFMITPVYPEDAVLSDVMPPEITSVTRDLMKPFPKPTENTDVFINVQKGSSDITLVKVIYTVDGGVENEVTAALEGSTYKAIIPAQPDNSLVRFRAVAIDQSDKSSTYPLNGTFVYRVLERNPKIADVREHLNPNGSSAYIGFTVTLWGNLSADPSDIAGETFTRMFMQDVDNQPYSGMFLITESPDDEIRTFGRGDIVRVTGTITESGARATDRHITALTNITTVTHIGAGNIMPPILSTEKFSKKSLGNVDAEPWESMLVEFRNVVVVDTNADTGSNFGEFLVADKDKPEATMRVEVDDSNISITNNPTVENKTQIKIGQEFPYLRGIMFYSFGNYKLIPRNDQDFEIVTSVQYSPLEAPGAMRAFPNPFSGETTVECTLRSYTPQVLIRVVDMEGRTVHTSVQNNLSAGVYRFALNGSLLAAGSYRCTIETAAGVVSTQLLVVR